MSSEIQINITLLLFNESAITINQVGVKHEKTRTVMPDTNTIKHVKPDIIFGCLSEDLLMHNAILDDLTAEFNAIGEPVKIVLHGNVFINKGATSTLFECREHPEDSIIGYELHNKEGLAIRVDKEVAVIQMGFAMSDLFHPKETNRPRTRTTI